MTPAVIVVPCKSCYSSRVADARNLAIFRVLKHGESRCL